MQYVYILSLFILTSCGFAPVYGSKSSNNDNAVASVKNNLQNIEIAIIPDREGQFLRNALIDNFYHSGAPSNPKYILKINPITELNYNLDITIDSEATRRQIKLSTQMSLIDKESGRTLLTRDVLSIASHNVLDSEFSTIVTEQNARENALNDLARQIEREISLYF